MYFTFWCHIGGCMQHGRSSKTIVGCRNTISHNFWFRRARNWIFICFSDMSVPNWISMKISFYSISCSRRFASPSANTARPYAYNSFRTMSFVHIFQLISSTTAINNNGTKARPVSGQHLLSALLILPFHTAPCSSCPHTSFHHPDLRPLGPPSTPVFPSSFLLGL
jgi:hypothetical protein